jgi:hypothetical protein
MPGHCPKIYEDSAGVEGGWCLGRA